METLRSGSRGPAVTLLQGRLRALGFLPGPVDGDFGGQTDRAVRQFQASHNLKVDGVVGDRTWALVLAGPAVDVGLPIIESDRRRLLAKIPAALSPTARRTVLEAAIASVGWREDPDGSNGGPELDEISTGLPGWDYAQGKPPWCALAVSWWLHKGLAAKAYDAIPFGRRLAAVAEIERWAKEGGRVVLPRTDVRAEPGAIFTMSRTGSGSDTSTLVAAGHCGFVLHDDGDSIVTIEGNTGNCVSSRSRRKSTLRVLVRWW